jgi:hypothetical protein
MAPSDHYALTVTDRRQALVDGLTARLPRVGLAGVVLDRTARRTAVPGEAAGDGLTWEDRDADDPRWWPQGVASTGDRLLVSWYAKRRWGLTPGARLSVVDPVAARYAHVLLVSPRRRSAGCPWAACGCTPAASPCSATSSTSPTPAAGVRVFRLGDVVRVPLRRLDALLPWPVPAPARSGAG